MLDDMLNELHDASVFFKINLKNILLNKRENIVFTIIHL